MRQVAAQRLQLRQRLLARHPREPLGGETLNQLGGGRTTPDQGLVGCADVLTRDCWLINKSYLMVNILLNIHIFLNVLYL